MWQAEGMFVCGRLQECLCVAGCRNVCVWQAEGTFVCGRLRERLCVAG